MRRIRQPPGRELHLRIRWCHRPTAEPLLPERPRANRDRQRRLYADAPRSPTEAKSRCAPVSRILSKLRGHGLLAKVRGARLYRVTDHGQRVMGLAIRFRQLEFPTAMTA